MKRLSSLKTIRRNFFKEKTQEVKQRWREWEVQRKQSVQPNYYSPDKYGEPIPHKWFSVKRIKELSHMFEDYFNTNWVSKKIPAKQQKRYVKHKLDY